jgi:uncharacterized membrane protein YebE (DUF533 family)
MIGNLLGGVVGSLLGGGVHRGPRAMRYFTHGRRSFLNTSTLLGAAGVAWGLYEVAKSRSSTPAAGGPSPSAGPPAPIGGSLPAVPPPLPQTAPSAVPSGAADLEVAAELRTARLLIAAARADGQIGEEELERLLEVARAAGVEATLRAEWDSPRPLAEIVAGVRDPAHQRDLYVLAYGVLRADDDVTGAERIFLAQLAARLGLDAATAARLEAETRRAIDAERG